MESKRRIRQNLRLEIESTAREIQELEEELSSNPSPEKEQNLEKLKSYYDKLQKQYESISGMDLETASKLKSIKVTNSSSSSWTKKLILSISALLMAGGFYNMMLQALQGYTINEVIIDISSGFLVSDFDKLIAKTLTDPALTIIVATVLSGSILNLIGELLPSSKQIDWIEAGMIFIVGIVMSYSLLGNLLGLMSEGDIRWIFIDFAFTVAFILLLAGIAVGFASLLSTPEWNDYKVLGIIEALFIIAASGSYFLGIILGGDQNILYQWPNIFLLLLTAMSIRTIRMLIRKES